MVQFVFSLAEHTASEYPVSTLDQTIYSADYNGCTKWA